MFEADRQGQGTVTHSTVCRVLARNGLVRAQDQAHKRKYRRWQREAPMALWQMDIMGGVFLAGGRECKLVTGIDDHSRFVVIAAVAAQPTGRAVCEAFAGAMRRYGVPAEVLTDNGKQFTGRFTKPRPAEVMFERVCRENGITARLTKPRSPTTTGKIERLHGSLRTELLNDAEPFASAAAAQQAISAWVTAYNYSRPHQSLQMATPASVFRPSSSSSALPGTPPADGAAGLGAEEASGNPGPDAGRARLPVVAPPAPVPAASGAVEFEVLVPPGGTSSIAQSAQQLHLGKAWAGHTATIWASQRTIHVSIGGRHLRTFASRLSADHLRYLRMQGARPAGPEPAPPALARENGANIVPAGPPRQVVLHTQLIPRGSGEIPPRPLAGRR